MIRPNFRDFSGGSTLIIHSAKGSTWKDHKYIKKIDGTYYYPKDYKGGGRKIGSSDKEGILSQLEDITGMKREYLSELYEVSRKQGYKSDEYKELLEELSEGDPDQAKKMEKLLKSEKSSKDSKSEGYEVTKEDYEDIAREVIRGGFGNGAKRKELLGDHYSEVQSIVNRMMKELKGG